jgi:hypothetical protein
VNPYGCFGWIINLVFWALLYSGRDELDPRWRWSLALVWVALWLGASRIPGGDLFFMSLVALLDIILVMVVLKGDVRIT